MAGSVNAPHGVQNEGPPFQSLEVAGDLHRFLDFFLPYPQENSVVIGDTGAVTSPLVLGPASQVLNAELKELLCVVNVVVPARIAGVQASHPHRALDVSSRPVLGSCIRASSHPFPLISF